MPEVTVIAHPTWQMFGHEAKLIADGAVMGKFSLSEPATATVPPETKRICLRLGVSKRSYDVVLPSGTDHTLRLGDPNDRLPTYRLYTLLFALVCFIAVFAWFFGFIPDPLNFLCLAVAMVGLYNLPVLPLAIVPNDEGAA
ncbi:MAG: hypothetical protein AAGI89_04050 [Pseudomonadota bacterium]